MEKGHLPILGVGPLYVVTIILMTIISITLSATGIIPVITFANFQWIFILIGILCFIIGITLWLKAVIIDRLDAHIIKNELVTTGVYAYVRNPVYSAFMFVCTGVLLIYGNLVLLVLPIIYWGFMTVLMKSTGEKWLEHLSMERKRVMNDTSSLQGVEDTLYIPLYARIYASKRFPNYFYDEKALLLENHISLKKIAQNTFEYFNMASVCRQQMIDKKIISFLENNHACNVIFLGAGLETAYFRIRNNSSNFYEVDLEHVIAVREKLLGHGKNEMLIGCDMFSMEWVKYLDTSKHTLIVLAGVFQYFTKDKIIHFIHQIQKRIPKCEMVFDATDSIGLKRANIFVRRTGNVNAEMYFAIDNPYEFAKDTNTKLVSVSGFFADALKQCKGLKLISKIVMFFSDRLKRTMVIHLRLN